MGRTHPVAVRFTDEDWDIIDALRKATGLTVPGVLRLALRTLRDRLESEKHPKRQK